MEFHTKHITNIDVIVENMGVIEQIDKQTS